MSATRVNVRDLVPLATSLTARQITDEGVLIAPGKINRTGVQAYTAKELGLDVSAGMAPDKLVALYRPPEEVFAADTLASFAAKPITMNHPPEDVTSTNWRKYAVGDLHNIGAADPHTTATLMFRDQKAIDAVQGGKSQLSSGYSFELDMTPGTAPDGTPYIGVQRKIKANHQAIVDNARGGHEVRVADGTSNDEEIRTMETIEIGGIKIKVDDTQASIIQKLVGDATKATADAVVAKDAAEKRAIAADAALGEEKAKSAQLVTDHAAAITESKAKEITPEKIEALAAERSKVVGDAAKLAPDLKPEGKTVAAIRIEALTEVIAKDEQLKPAVLAGLGGVEPAKANEAVIKAVFDSIAATRVVTNDGRQVSARDAAYASALAGSHGPNSARAGDAGKTPTLYGRDLMIYRESHGGKSPEQAKA